MRKWFKSKPRDPALEEFKADMETFYDSLERYLTTGKGCLTAKDNYRRLRGVGLTSHEILNSDHPHMKALMKAICIKMQPTGDALRDADFYDKMGIDMMFGAMVSSIFGDENLLKEAIIDVFDALMMVDCKDCNRGTY